MTIAGKRITVQSIHGRQYFKEDGEWQQYACIRHAGKRSYDIRVTDTIPVNEQLKLVAEEVLLIVEKHQPKRAKKTRKGARK